MAAALDKEGNGYRLAGRQQMPETMVEDVVLAILDHAPLYLVKGEDAGIQIEDLNKGRQLHRLHAEHDVPCCPEAGEPIVEDVQGAIGFLCHVPGRRGQRREKDDPLVRLMEGIVTVLGDGKCR